MAEDVSSKAAPSNIEGQFLAWEAERNLLWNFANNPENDEDVTSQYCDDSDAIDALICKTPAKTISDALVKLRSVHKAMAANFQESVDHKGALADAIRFLEAQ